MSKKLIGLLLVSFCFLSAQSTFADHCPCMKKMTQELKLTSEQQAKFKEIKQNTKDLAKSKESELKSLHAEIKDLIKAEKMDEAKLDKLVQKKEEILGSMMKARIMAQHQMYQALDTEQKVKFLKKLDHQYEMKHKMHKAS